MTKKCLSGKQAVQCSSKASLQYDGYEDHYNDVEPPMSVYEYNGVEVDYKFHKDAVFVQIKLGLEEVNVEEV